MLFFASLNKAVCHVWPVSLELDTCTLDVVSQLPVYRKSLHTHK